MTTLEGPGMIPVTVPDGVDLEHIRSAAANVADLLTYESCVEVALTPGDSTVYRLVISRPSAYVGSDGRWIRGGDLCVSMLTPNSSSCVWGPTNSGWTDWPYVADHWCVSEWTSRILASFLNFLRQEMAG